MPGEQQRRRWQSFRDAAADSMSQASMTRQRAAVPADRHVAGFGQRLRGARDTWLADARRRPTGSSGRLRRTDLRLVPAALLVWGTALAGGWLEPAAIGALCAGLSAAAVLLLMPLRRRHPATRTDTTRGRARISTARSVRATFAAALALSVAAAAHAAVASAQRHDGPVAQAVAAGASVVAELDVAGQPKRLAIPARSGEADRWAVPAALRVLVYDGRRVEARAAIIVLGGAAWGDAAAGQRFHTTGTLKPAGPGEAEAGMLSVTSPPVRISTHDGGARGSWPGGGLAPGELRSSFAAAAAGLRGDARGLLPGMVTGDTSGLDPQLAAAMKTVGMTHLTAVSGANCSLVLGALLLAARTLRLSRPAAAAAALAGLGLFVLMVGPEPSVLRAAGMGAIGLSALVAGRVGRGLSLLCVASTGLLLAEPALAADFGFVLSVLATLGIILAGRPIMEWLPAVVPRPVAAGLAVPLSAQLFCGPVIVLLQPQFSTYALAANLAAAALVAPVTLLGTAAVPLLPWAPAVAAVPVAAAGSFASGVAGIARYFAALPGAVLPWPEGALGAATMALFSGLTLSLVWLATHPAATWHGVLTLQQRTALRLEGILDRPARGLPGCSAQTGPRRRSLGGLVDRPRRGRLRVCKPTSRRTHEWLLPKPNAPGPRRRIPPPGAT